MDATMSVELPGANATTGFIGLSGTTACAGVQIAAATQEPTRRRFM